MRKLVFIAFIIVSTLTFAQEAATRKTQAGMAFKAGININEAATKNMKVTGTGSNLSVGVDVHHSFNNSIGFYSGISIDFETNKIAPGENSGKSYYYFNDTDIPRFDKLEGDETLYQWTSRTQKPVYITIPTMMLFRTKFFAYKRFHGKFGLRNSILVDNKINDVGFTFKDNDFEESTTALENKNMIISRDMNFFRSSAGFSFGAEWNFSGPTSLVAEMGYYFGFVPIYANNSKKNQTTFFIDEDNNNQHDYYSNNMRQNQLIWKLALFF
jgi:hypothetical protein